MGTVIEAGAIVTPDGYPSITAVHLADAAARACAERAHRAPSDYPARVLECAETVTAGAGITVGAAVYRG